MEIESIDTRQLCRERLPVLITHLESPLLFWIRLRNNERDFEKLEEDLNFWMTGRIAVHLEPQEIQRGIAVAVKDDGFWHRGLLIRTKKTEDMVKVLLKDIGRAIILPKDKIYKLRDEFKKLPWQAIACGLPYTGPGAATSVWPYDIIKFCRLIAEEHKGWIEIKQPLWEGAALVTLQIQTESFYGSYDFKKTLIRFGIARQSTRKIEHVFPCV